MKKQVYIAQSILFMLFFCAVQLVEAQEPISQVRMEAIQSLEGVLLAGGDMDQFIEEKLTPTYRSSLPPNAMKDHLKTLSKAVSNAQALEINVEPDAVQLIFSEGASSTILVRFASGDSELIEYIGFMEQKSFDEMTASERLSLARRTRIRAIEALGRARDRQLDSFLDTHVSPTLLNTIDRSEMIANLQALRKIIATSGVIMFDQTDEGSLLKFRGSENANVLLALDPAEPYLISSLMIDTKVDVSAEEQEKAAIAPINWDNLDQRLEEETEAGFSGAVLAVRSGKHVLQKGYGLADRNSGQENTSSTIFGIGSIPIDFTIAALLKLEDEGLLSLSDPVSTFFPKPLQINQQ